MNEVVEDQVGQNSGGEDEDNPKISDAVEKRQSLKRTVVSDSDDRLVLDSHILFGSYFCVLSSFG